MKVTINPSVRQPDECTHVELEKTLARFKTDKNGIQDIRRNEDPDQRQKLKVELPVVIFGGTFEKRSNKHLIEASGLMVLDFDCYSLSGSKKIEGKLKNDPYVHAYFKSTLGVGWKALVRIPKVKDDQEYKLYWYAVEEHFPDVDPACKDISRACFYSYDPNLVYRPDSKIWKKKKDPNLQRASQKVSKGTNYGLINRALNLIRNAEVGERHNKILAASRLCGGWVAAGKVDYQEAQRLLENEAQKVDPDDFKTNQQAVVDGLDHGMQSPLTDEETEKELSHARLQEKFDKIYWTLSDVWDEVESKYEIGLEDGYTTGYEDIDKLYKMYLGYTTYLYGPAFSGKSLVWFDFLKNFSYRYGMRHAVFSPETGSATDVHVKLLQMVAGKDFYNNHGYQMSKEELKEARKFVDQHFIVIDPGMETMDLDDLIASCEMIERVYGTKLHTLTIDPWNDLDHNMEPDNWREDKYLEKALKKLRVTAHYNHWHICVITHARDQAMIEKAGNKFYPPATFREVAGGQAWSRRGFMMASVWRPPQGLSSYEGIELEGNETLWIQQKYKPEWAGEKGAAVLRYKPQEHRFYTGKGALKRYANLDPKQQAQQTYIEEEVPF